MRVFAVDPGDQTSGAVIIGLDCRLVHVWPKVENGLLLEILQQRQRYSAQELAIEMPRARGMPASNQLFDTCAMVGHFEATFGTERSFRVDRHRVKVALCGRANAKDSNISAAIRDLYPQTGVGHRPAVGTKARPGPLYGVSKDAWQALAVGLTHLAINHGVDLHTIPEQLGVIA